MKIKISVLVSLVIAGVLYSCTSNNKNSFTITGQIPKEIKIDSIFIYTKKADVLFGAPVKDGKFKIEGSVKNPEDVILGSMKADFSLTMILENDNYDVSIKGNNYYIKGGKIQQILFGHLANPQYVALVNDYLNTEEKAFKNIDMENEAAVTHARKVVDSVAAKVMNFDDSISNNILNGDYPAIVKAFALVHNQDWKRVPVEKRYELLNKYEKEAGKLAFIDNYRKFLKEGEEQEATKALVTNGTSYKEVAASNVNGKVIQLSDVISKNKFTILEFWASWCSPCRGEIPNLKKAYAKYHSKGLEIYSISLDDKKEKWLKALDEEKTPWFNTVDLQAFEAPAAKSYGIVGIPAAFLIDQSGKIVANNDELREFNLDKTLSKLIK